MSIFALLAPVPHVHLESAEETLKAHGSVAFGSRAFDVFGDLNALIQQHGVPSVNVYIYASHKKEDDALVVSWKGRYQGICDPLKLDPKLRPDSAKHEDADKKFETRWLLYWLVSDLQRLPPSQQVNISDFVSYPTKMGRDKWYIPRGPELVSELIG